MSYLLALESSCDETAAAVADLDGTIISSAISSQIEVHRRFGGVVPEVASRNHILQVRPLIERVLSEAGTPLSQIEAFAATTGPGLVSSLLIGTSVAKAMALAQEKPYLAIHHMEGHLLSPFMHGQGPIRPCIGLIVSGGHTQLLQVRQLGDYLLLGQSRDDAAGEAFDKIGKMLGLPYPGGPEIDRLAKQGNPEAYTFPRSFLTADSFEFSFSGLKTAVLYEKPRWNLQDPQVLADVCASVQAAIIEVLVEKAVRACHSLQQTTLAVSGGVSCNHGLRSALQARCRKEGLELLLAHPAVTTDNAAMIAFTAVQYHRLRQYSAIESEVCPRMPLGRDSR